MCFLDFHQVARVSTRTLILLRVQCEHTMFHARLDQAQGNWKKYMHIQCELIEYSNTFNPIMKVALRCAIRERSAIPQRLSYPPIGYY
jgi:hypothetical protein